MAEKIPQNPIKKEGRIGVRLEQDLIEKVHEKLEKDNTNLTAVIDYYLRKYLVADVER